MDIKCPSGETIWSSSSLELIRTSTGEHYLYDSYPSGGYLIWVNEREIKEMHEAISKQGNLEASE